MKSDDTINFRQIIMSNVYWSFFLVLETFFLQLSTQKIEVTVATILVKVYFWPMKFST